MSADHAAESRAFDPTAGSGWLLIRIAHQRYAVAAHDLAGVQRIAPADTADSLHTSDLAPLSCELSALLATGQEVQPGRHALLVPLAGEIVALLVTEVEDLVESATALALPPLLRHNMRQSWSSGVLWYGEEIVVILDARAIASSALSAVAAPAAEL